MIEHLIVSTLVLAVAMIAARVLPLTARTRYAIVLAGLVKFAIPTLPAQVVPAPIAPVQSSLRIFGGGAAARAVAESSSRIEWLPIAWGTIALLLFARWYLLRARTISAALHIAAPASPRERAAISEARAALRVRSAVDVVRSPICEAPAVVRVIRPVLVLPHDGADALTDDELRSLVLHECAHVARHDNFASLVQALTTSLLWFHPLVWLASRQLSAAREEACDEAVVESTRQTDSYLDALGKLCHAALAPRTAGVSCMANARIKERIDHLMKYDILRSRAFSHRTMIAATLLLVALSLFAGTPQKPMQELYKLSFTITPNTNVLQFDVSIIEVATGAVVASPHISTPPGVRASVQDLHAGRDILLEVEGAADGTAKLFLQASENGTVVQRSLWTHDPVATRYTGDPISLNLKNADVRDVLKTFAEMTGLQMVIDDDVRGSVTMEVEGRPWDQVLDEILEANGLEGKLDGKTLRIRRK